MKDPDLGPLPIRLMMWQGPVFIIVLVLMLLTVIITAINDPRSPAAPFIGVLIGIVITLVVVLALFLGRAGNRLRRAAARAADGDTQAFWAFNAIEIVSTTPEGAELATARHRQGWILQKSDSIEFWVWYRNEHVLTVKRSEITSITRQGERGEVSYPTLRIVFSKGSVVSTRLVGPPPSFGVGASVAYVDGVVAELTDPHLSVENPLEA